MGLEKQSGRKNFLTISDGKLVLQHQNPIEGVTIERENKNGKIVHEEFFTAIKARITNIQSKDTTFGMVWEIELTDEDGTVYLLSWNYSSRYTNNFFRALPNVDLSQPVKLSPWSMKDKNDSSKKVTGITMYQGAANGKIPFAFDKENPNGMPEMVKKKIKGKDVWDDSAQLEFFESMVKNQILPQLNASKYDVVAETVTADDDTEDAPF